MQSACELAEEESKLIVEECSEIMSCSSITLPPFDKSVVGVDDIQRSILNDSKKLNKNKKKKVRRQAKRLEQPCSESELDSIKEMLHQHAFANRVIVLSQDETQMQKTLNQAMQLVS